MASTDVQRKLTAILVSDVVGYSRLMGDDPEGTLTTLTAYRQIFSHKIQEYKGRVVNAPGDSLLAEFTSVVDAVSCAVDLQREFAERNQELPDHRRMDFRIGVNLGDVLVKEGALYGDGVNVAARLEALADPGGICISRTVYDQVRARLPLHFEYLGEQAVKNIAEPVRAYSVNLTSMENEKQVEQPKTVSAQSLMPEGLSLELPDRPSIAVLPFVNISGDTEQEYFSDGITDDIITDLSRLPRLFVIARNSSFQYKGQHVDVRKVGEELGVKYVLEGSVRKAGDRVRITAQLIDAKSGSHIWAHRYDRQLSDIFAIQDEISRIIAGELQVKLVEGEQARVWRTSTTSLEAYDLALRGRDLLRQFNRADYLRGRQLLEKALQLDSGFAYAMAGLGWTYVVEGFSGWGESPNTCFEKAIELGNQAIALNDSLGEAYSMLSGAHMNLGKHDQGLAYAERAVALNPGDADSNVFLCGAYVRVGRGNEALDRIKTALRLNPYPPDLYLRYLGAAYRSLGRFQESIAAYRKCLDQIPDQMYAQLGLTLAYMEAGREEEGQAQARHVLRINSNFSSSSNSFVTTYKDPATRERYIELLRQAGLPE